MKIIGSYKDECVRREKRRKKSFQFEIINENRNYEIDKFYKNKKDEFANISIFGTKLPLEIELQFFN